LLTLTGPGGVGKTRVAFQVAAELLDVFADGVYLVSLAHIDDPAMIIPTLARTFGFGTIAGEELTGQVKAYLREKRLLLLLDNFEHLVAGTPLVVDLLTSCPELKLLVTSRASLRLRGEHQFPLPLLAIPDSKHPPDAPALSQYTATILFVQRALAVDPDFQVTDTSAPVIAEICARLDGLPLAIELAAARVKLLSPQSLLERLEHSLQILTGGAHDLPERQQTLYNTLKWSYDLLNESERRLFRRLSVFAGGCTLEAVEAVSALPGDGELNVLDGVTSLLDKSQLQRLKLDVDGRNERRLVMLETIREFGLELLAKHGEMEATQQAHAAYYLALVEKAEPNLTGTVQEKWFDHLEREHENLRAALSYLVERAETKARAQEKTWHGEKSQAEMALRLGAALCGFWAVRGYCSEGFGWLERVLAADAEVAPAVRAKALNAAGMLACLKDSHERAEQLCSESLALFRHIGDKRGAASSLFWLGQIAKAKRDYAAERALLEESLLLSKEVEDKDAIASCLEGLAGVIAEQGEPVRAILLWGAVESIREAIGRPIPPFEQADYERIVAKVRAQLSEQAFATIWAEGKKMNSEQALVAEQLTTILLSLDAVSTELLSTAPIYPAGLSVREVEVLRLIADGLTNAQIADQLVISPLTVNTHVRSIYSKLEVSSRSAATRFAIQQHLV
jgi:predicted ATPase/DNA-binding CsgD family transcriptional regulator